MSVPTSQNLAVLYKDHSANFINGNNVCVLFESYETLNCTARTGADINIDGIATGKRQ